MPSRQIHPTACSGRQCGRITDMNKVDNWFKRNCKDVLNRACTPQEKGDVLTYLLTIRK